MEKFFKVCGCCGTGYTKEGWKLLEELGRMKLTEEEDTLVLRNCHCGTTLAAELEREEGGEP